MSTKQVVNPLKSLWTVPCRKCGAEAKHPCTNPLLQNRPMVEEVHTEREDEWMDRYALLVHVVKP